MAEPDRIEGLRAALEAELGRQGVVGADTDRLARIAIEQLEGPTVPPAEGKRPEELNSTNDD
jgi:hypothetical protein